MDTGLQSFFCDNGVTLLPHGLQKGSREGQSGSGPFLLIDQERGKIFVHLVKESQIVFHVPFRAESVFRQQNGQLGLGAGGGRQGIVVIGEAA